MHLYFTDEFRVCAYLDKTINARYLSIAIPDEEVDKRTFLEAGRRLSRNSYFVTLVGWYHGNAIHIRALLTVVILVCEFLVPQWNLILFILPFLPEWVPESVCRQQEGFIHSAKIFQSAKGHLEGAAAACNWWTSARYRICEEQIHIGNFQIYNNWEV